MTDTAILEMTPKLMQVLIGVRLVPFTDSHITDRYVSWLNDPEVVKAEINEQLMYTIGALNGIGGVGDMSTLKLSIGDLPPKNNPTSLNIQPIRATRPKTSRR